MKIIRFSGPGVVGNLLNLVSRRRRIRTSRGKLRRRRLNRRRAHYYVLLLFFFLFF
jgi:hypothetical protein